MTNLFNIFQAVVLSTFVVSSRIIRDSRKSTELIYCKFDKNEQLLKRGD